MKVITKVGQEVKRINEEFVCLAFSSKMSLSMTKGALYVHEVTSRTKRISSDFLVGILYDPVIVYPSVRSFNKLRKI